MNSDPQVVRIVFPIAGTIVLMITIAASIENQHFINNASKAEGRIVKRDHKTHIEFTPQQG